MATRKTRLLRVGVRGFSLIEMAIVMVILAGLLGGLFTAVGQSSENMRRLEAKKQLQEIEEALYGFGQVQGRLPCPSDFDTSGFEDVASTTSGACNLVHGLLPHATLGLSGSVDNNGLLTDPWDNPYRYSVTTGTPGGFRYTGTDGIQSIYNDASNQVVAHANTLRVCDDTACSGVTMTDITPAVVLSMGRNWAGIASASAEETGNASGTTLGSTYSVTDTNIFVLDGYSEENFDDMLVWISPHLLFSKMISAGKLP